MVERDELDTAEPTEQDTGQNVPASLLYGLGVLIALLAMLLFYSY
jgi:hypothetical protein